MITKIRCPSCNKAHLYYNKPRLADLNHDRSEALWRCTASGHVRFSSRDLHLILKEAGGIDIDSVNYPYRLHITAEGVTAG